MDQVDRNDGRRWTIRGQELGLWPKVVGGPSFEDEEEIEVVEVSPAIPKGAHRMTRLKFCARSRRTPPRTMIGSACGPPIWSTSGRFSPTTFPVTAHGEMSCESLRLRLGPNACRAHGAH
jgi:hypothetical protein